MSGICWVSLYLTVRMTIAPAKTLASGEHYHLLYEQIELWLFPIRAVPSTRLESRLSRIALTVSRRRRSNGKAGITSKTCFQSTIRIGSAKHNGRRLRDEAIIVGVTRSPSFPCGGLRHAAKAPIRHLSTKYLRASGRRS